METADHRSTLIALNLCPDLSRAAICALGGCVEHWMQSPSGAALRSLARRLAIPSEHLAVAKTLVRHAHDTAIRELQRAQAAKVEIITRSDPSYPAELLQLDLPPPVLYLRGQLVQRPRLAVVGSRAATRYGIEAAGSLASELAVAGITIVSGMARGIDAAAHQGALSAVAGRTVAVLGCGVDVPYPRGHRALAARIADRGALVSEFGFGVEPRPWHFPVRNRLIAALSAGTLVVEAAARSGSLITARLALELGREVFAVPGRIFDRKAIGPNTLIRDGATPVQQPRDVLEALVPARTAEDTGAQSNSPNVIPAPGGSAGRIVAALPPGDAISPEDLARALDLPIDRLLSELLELELAGWVRREPGPMFRRSANGE